MAQLTAEDVTTLRTLVARMEQVEQRLSATEQQVGATSTSANALVAALREEFETDVRVLGSADTMNMSIEKVNRVADFFELGELMCQDALMREESCGGHFREEHQTEEGEAKRDDENFQFVGAWEFTGDTGNANLHKEELVFENVTPTTRSYK